MEKTEERPDPVFVQPKPYKVLLEAGKEYYMCACGKSQDQPFCDGSHRAEGIFKPKKLVVDETKDYYVCGCKHTKHEMGLCDGTHRKEEGIRKYNQFLLKSNSELKTENEKLQTRVNNVERKIVVANVVAVLSAVVLAIGLGGKFRPTV